jgi:hypothetical protein
MDVLATTPRGDEKAKNAVFAGVTPISQAVRTGEFQAHARIFLAAETRKDTVMIALPKVRRFH